MPDLNYAESYSRELSQAFPYALNFGALYSTPNNGRYKWVDSQTIKIPSLSVGGRIDASRDTITGFTRNFDNDWESKQLKNHREWSTLVHPEDIDETNMVASIGNITRVMNEEQKFPEMDAYLASKVFTDWSAISGNVADTTSLTISSILEVFDDLMLKMDNARVPANGRILYVTHEAKKLLKNAEDIQRTLDVQSAADMINRNVNRLDEVEVIGVPSTLMKTAYTFTEGYVPKNDANQINMFLVHPLAVITPVKYEFSQVGAPTAQSKGKYLYFEESYEDVFILNKKSGAIQFNITEHTAG